ncbi:MAG: HlyD family efflux transporter periplasmic adaptor subunit [Chloroflexi bacterium]|nr:HlyD family efflux transporter periplasmic adaptor subunit [Chloroflexota bacterium]
MPLDRIRRVAPIVVFGGLVVAGLIYLTLVSGEGKGPLTASGTVEAVQVGVASEVSGRVLEVLVEEGESVRAGDPVLRLDSRLVEAQRERAVAAGEAAVAAAQLELISAQVALDALYDNAPLAAAQAELALANARDALDDAQRIKTYQQKGNRATQETLDGAEAALTLAEQALDRAQTAYDRTTSLPENHPTRAAARAALEAARRQRDQAEASLNWFKGAPSDIDQAILSAKVSLAQAQLGDAQRRFEELSAGPDLDLLAQAGARLTLAKASLAAARAQATVEAETIDLQLDKLLVTAPLKGVVLARSIEPGEVLLAGAQALSIGQLDRLTVTVFLPEDRYGQVDLGDHVELAVDAFPDQIFDAVVTRIADRAEFTPRNVQTQEGRRTTVFAIELTVADPGGLLKPGMPADVTFGAG